MKNHTQTDFTKYFSDLRAKDGILLCGGDEIESKFSDTVQDDLFGIEDTSWWFQYRAEVIARLAHIFLKKDKYTFDVGGGNGYTTHYLQKLGYSTVLLEPSFAACINAKRRGLRVIICGTLAESTVLNESMEQIAMLDVLEHIEDDKEFLKTVWKKLIPGGRILVTVPAFQELWSSEDNSAGHYRRYRLKALKELAQATGFEVLYINYFFKFLFLPILLVRVGFEKIGLLKRSEQRTKEEKERITAEQFQEKSGIVGCGLKFLEQCEIDQLAHNKKLKFGSSIICVLEKRLNVGY